MPARTQTAGEIQLKRLTDDELSVPIVGLSPVIPHKWSEKALRMMREKQMGQVLRPKREPKVPEEDAQQSCYWLADGRPGMPATAFKAAMVDACRFFEGLAMTTARRMLFIVGDGPEMLVAIEGERHLREDTPRNDNGTADLRYRYSFWPWRATVTVRYPTGILSAESVINLLDAAGRGGVGDWRPSSPKSATGTFGTWRVDEEATR